MSLFFVQSDWNSFCYHCINFCFCYFFFNVSYLNFFPSFQQQWRNEQGSACGLCFQFIATFTIYRWGERLRGWRLAGLVTKYIFSQKKKTWGNLGGGGGGIKRRFFHPMKMLRGQIFFLPLFLFLCSLRNFPFWRSN